MFNLIQADSISKIKSYSFTSAFFTIAFILIFSNVLTAQDFYCKSSGTFIKLSADIVDCGDCTYQVIGPGPIAGSGMSFGPNGILYGRLYADIYEIDPVTGAS